jgi:hypothetical protein
LSGVIRSEKSLEGWGEIDIKSHGVQQNNGIFLIFNSKDVWDL